MGHAPPALEGGASTGSRSTLVPGTSLRCGLCKIEIHLFISEVKWLAVNIREVFPPPGGCIGVSGGWIWPCSTFLGDLSLPPGEAEPVGQCLITSVSLNPPFLFSQWWQGVLVGGIWVWLVYLLPISSAFWVLVWVEIIHISLSSVEVRLGYAQPQTKKLHVKTYAFMLGSVASQWCCWLYSGCLSGLGPSHGCSPLPAGFYCCSSAGLDCSTSQKAPSPPSSSCSVSFAVSTVHPLPPLQWVIQPFGSSTCRSWLWSAGSEPGRI